MGRESSAHDRAAQRIGVGGGGALRRWAGLGALGLLTVLFLAGCGPVQNQIYSTTTPGTAKAEDIHFLYQILFWSSLVVFVAVQAGIVYTILRFRRRNRDRPLQIHGNTRLEIAWTIIPAVILVFIFIPTAQTIFKHAAAEESADFVVDVYGKQWWWEIEYPEIPAKPENPDTLPLITANELRVPQGANVLLNLQSNNVIHSFWVPQLSGKMDVIPGHQNRIQFTADNVGEYYGECAEFCGAAHAWMRFKVIVMPPADFDAWVEAWRSPPPIEDSNPETQGVVEVPAAFGTCLACHQVEDTNAAVAPEGFGTNPIPNTGNPGPNLTLLGCRETIAAGLLLNTEENLKTWIMHTDEVKPGVYMPNYFKDGQLTEAQVDELAAYLTQLKPEGGCPPRYPIGGEIATPIAVTE